MFWKDSKKSLPELQKLLPIPQNKCNIFSFLLKLLYNIVEVPMYVFELSSTFAAVEAEVGRIIAYLQNRDCPGLNRPCNVIDFALRELLNNAVEHGNEMNPAKKVSGRVDYSRGRLLLEVFDEGPGFTLTPKMLKIGPFLEDRGRGLAILVRIGFRVRATRKGVRAEWKVTEE
jgi:anti-sigma regulatory factor (Ser/Thr protein kinase)